MNVYVIFIIIGLALQLCGIIGFLSNTKVEVTKEKHTYHDRIFDNDTGEVLQESKFYKLDDIIRDYKLVKRE